MRSLFLKIFLWFWLTVVLISSILMATTVITRTNSLDVEWQNRAFVAAEAASAVDVYEREGPEALRQHLQHLPKRPVYAYLIDEHGTEVLGQKLPVQGIQLARPDNSLPSLLLGPGAKPGYLKGLQAYPPLPPKSARGVLKVTPLAVDPKDFGKNRPAKVIAEQLTGASGQLYTFMVVIPPLSARTILASLAPGTFFRLGAVLLLAGILCFWLAHHITVPVLKLRDAASHIAEGHLNTRVRPAMADRRDEIGVLGQHFDRMAERIESVVAGQQRLMSTVSHELRSPLTRLSVAAALLRQCPEEEKASYLDRIELETEQLNQLIAQLLTLARVESGDASPQKQAVDLTSLVQEIAVDGDFEARARSCYVTVGQLDPCITTGVTDQIRRAIENVVRNAIRHTKEHTEVEITMRQGGAQPSATALVRVRDYGPGVPDTDLQKIFQPFYRVAGNQDSDGAGLGLAITDRIARAHGGKVRAINAPGGGLLVELELPLKT